LVHIANIGFAAPDVRRNPSAQEIGIVLNICGKIKHLLATKGKQPPYLFDYHRRPIWSEVMLVLAARFNLAEIFQDRQQRHDEA
jgi:hypothetical protein